jgi:aminoglycoside 6'-N-acetyltransferase I
MGIAGRQIGLDVLVTIREMRADEVQPVLAMMRLLWPDCDDETIIDDCVFVIDRGDGVLGGFITLALRPWAEGCTSTPCAYIEGWWVAPELRRHGWGRKLVAAAERWAIAQGSRELGSDVELDNTGSLAAHGALGFEEVQRSVFFRKRL